MKNKFTIEITFEEEPLSSELIESTSMISELIAKNYVYPFSGSGTFSLGFGETRQTIAWTATIAEVSQ
jgi:hypothetical protein